MLAVTFDRPWEPYIRIIWSDVGALLDVIFCNCEGYVTARDHSFAEYAHWVRSDPRQDEAAWKNKPRPGNCKASPT